ncbi:uncharacterized protein [Ptychodera flava]
MSSGVGISVCINKKKLGDEMPKHQPIYIFYIIGSLWMYAASLLFAQLSVALGVEWGIFLNKTQDISDLYHTDFTPAYWTFQIWPVIYIWFGGFLVYLVIGTCRRNSHDYVYVNPKIHTWVFFVFFMFNQGLNVGWVFLFDRQYMIPALAFVALIAFTSYIVLFDSMRNLIVHYAELNLHQRGDIWATRILVHNGLAIYATWTSIATLLNLCLVLHYFADIDMDTATLISHVIVSAEIVFWVIFENFIFDKYLRYTITIYPTAIVAYAGIIDENWDPTKTTSIYALVVLTVLSCLCVARFMLVIYRHIKLPIRVGPINDGPLSQDDKEAIAREVQAQSMEMKAHNQSFKELP